MMRHPKQRELFAYAEDLASGRPLAARLGRHVATCETCRAEVEAIRSSLEFAASASPLEPSESFTAGVLQAARQERRVQSTLRKRNRVVIPLVKAVGFAACLTIMAGFYFGATSGPTSFNDASTVQPMAPARLSESATPEIVEKASAEIESLTAAVRTHPKATPSVLEQEQRRAVKVQEEDLSAAMSALKRNPGNERVRNVVDSNVEHGAETLKSIYVEQSL